MTIYKVYHRCPSCNATEPYDFTNSMNKCWDCKSVYCPNCSTSRQGWGQCPNCGSFRITEPVDTVHQICGEEWWGWKEENRRWTTGKGNNETVYEKMD